MPRFIAIVRLLFVPAVIFLCAFITRVDTPLDRLVAALQKWADDNPQEKVYLHTDKPYYLVGDTIWFKGYITTGSRHQLSAISGALYVELINERDSIIKSLKIPVTAGMAIGDFLIGDELKQGNFRLRAYTQWMRNAGEDYFFHKSIIIGSVFNSAILTKANYQYKKTENKNVLTATLNYTDDKGQPLANKSVLYRIIIDRKVVWTKNSRTDDQGNILVSIANENKADLTGAYIRTILNNNQNKEVIKDFPVKANLSESDVQFFPEGGALVNGVLSRIGCKVLGVDGLGVNITGKIVDNENKEITDMITAHAGMGSFQLKPEPNKTYIAKINFNNGTVKSVALPKAEDAGYVLSVYQPNRDSILVRINTTQPLLWQSLNLVAQSNGDAIFASAIKIEKPLTSVWLDKKDFPTGIAQFTIFDSNGLPLNERIAFIRGSDLLQLKIKTNKTAYKSREQVMVEMNALDGNGKPTAGNFSVSVIDEGKLPSDDVNETSIFSSLLLSSDIKGYIEKPNYYFTNINQAVDKDLDNLMLTQGYRRFTWKDLKDSNSTPYDIANSKVNSTFKFPAESYGINISGQAQTLGQKPLANAVVTLLSVKAKMDRSAITDADGRFKFDGIVVKDSIKFTAQARTVKNSDKLKLILDTLPKITVKPNPNLADISINISESLKGYIEAMKKQDEIFEKLGRIDQVQRLRQVNIMAKKSTAPEVAFQFGTPVPPAVVDQTIILDLSKNCGTLGACLAGLVRGITFIPYNSAPLYPHYFFRGKLIPIKVVMNGRVLPNDEAAEAMTFETDLESIAKVEVIRTSVVFARGLYIYTKKDYVRRSYNPSVVNITPKGFNIARKFYIVKYDANKNTQIPDTRSTIYWDPQVKTAASGRGFVSFFNADAPGKYKLVVEGINADGQLGRQVVRIMVE